MKLQNSAVEKIYREMVAKNESLDMTVHHLFMGDEIDEDDYDECQTVIFGIEIALDRLKGILCIEDDNA